LYVKRSAQANTNRTRTHRQAVYRKCIELALQSGQFGVAFPSCLDDPFERLLS
jgi:hypothetical protein